MLILDHIAVAANTLAEGVAHVETTLGVTLEGGGQHSHFGTHNKLLGLAEGLYLEVIAIDPSAPPLPYPRWFDLDAFSGPPRLTNWITRCEDLSAALTRAHPQTGHPVSLTRGSLSWQMAVPPDGKLPFDNLHPALIEWAGSEHPVQHLAPSGCRLERIELCHPNASILQATLKPLFADDRVVIDEGPEPEMRAILDTPLGRKVL
jgi:hypothetical protein